MDQHLSLIPRLSAGTRSGCLGSLVDIRYGGAGFAPTFDGGNRDHYYIDVRQSDFASSLYLTPVSARQPQLGLLPQLLKVLADPTRLQIAGFLAQRELCVCDLEALLGASQSMTSHHLGVLRRAGLVLQRRDGRDSRWVYYRLNPEMVETMRSQFNQLLDLSGFDATPARCP